MKKNYVLSLRSFFGGALIYAIISFLLVVFTTGGFMSMGMIPTGMLFYFSFLVLIAAIVLYSHLKGYQFLSVNKAAVIITTIFQVFFYLFSYQDCSERGATIFILRWSFCGNLPPVVVYMFMAFAALYTISLITVLATVRKKDEIPEEQNITISKYKPSLTTGIFITSILFFAWWVTGEYYFLGNIVKTFWAIVATTALFYFMRGGSKGDTAHVIINSLASSIIFWVFYSDVLALLPDSMALTIGAVILGALLWFKSRRVVHDENLTKNTINIWGSALSALLTLWFLFDLIGPNLYIKKSSVLIIAIVLVSVILTSFFVWITAKYLRKKTIAIILTVVLIVPLFSVLYVVKNERLVNVCLSKPQKCMNYFERILKRNGGGMFVPM